MINSKKSFFYLNKLQMIFALLSIITLCINNINSVELEKVAFALNCGGDSYEDANGVVYESDDYYNTGQASDYGLQYDIELTKDEELYQTERWADKDLIYSLPFEQGPGQYVLVLKFSEVYFQASKEKVFDVAIGEKKIIKNIDVFDLVGKAKAHDEYIEFELKENHIIYHNVRFCCYF
jgi:hypothetical protein